MIEGGTAETGASLVRVVVVARSAEDSAAIAAWLTERCGAEVVGTATSGEAGMRLVGDAAPDLVVAELALLTPSGIELAERLWLQSPAVGCVLIGEGADWETERRALRAGALALIPYPLGDAARARFRSALADLGHRRGLIKAIARPSAGEPLARLGVLIAVLSAKGGVGRSFMAANLAACLAERTPTALVDLDLQFGDLSSWGEDGAVERTSIDQLAAVVATGEIQLEDVRAVARSRFGKVVLLPGTRSPLEGSTWASERGARAQRLVQSLRKWYAFVVVDGLPGVLEPVIRIARMSTLALVVSGCDAGSLRATQRYLELLDRFAPVPRLVIANRVDRGEPRPLVAKAIGVRERTVYLKEDRTFARRLVVEGLAAPQQRGRPLARGFLGLAELVERMAAAAATTAQ